MINRCVLPLRPLLKTDPWCNGNTPVFGTVFQGSNPCGSTVKKPSFSADRGLFLCLDFNMGIDYCSIFNFL
jgi:hypothetical protein